MSQGASNAECEILLYNMYLQPSWMYAADLVAHGQIDHGQKDQLDF